MSMGKVEFSRMTAGYVSNTATIRAIEGLLRGLRGTLPNEYDCIGDILTDAALKVLSFHIQNACKLLKFMRCTMLRMSPCRSTQP
jgi:hypothetical protein